jgi:hypothetical protein
VYFNHSIHIQKGVACVTCHGSVGDMPLLTKEHSLDMKWCLECHRDPEHYTTTRDNVFRPTLAQYAQFVKKENAQQPPDKPRAKSLTSCYTCHR